MAKKTSIAKPIDRTVNSMTYASEIYSWILSKAVLENDANFIGFSPGVLSERVQITRDSATRTFSQRQMRPRCSCRSGLAQLAL